MPEDPSPSPSRKGRGDDFDSCPPPPLAGGGRGEGTHARTSVNGTGSKTTLRLTRLTLTQFRNYVALAWRPAARVSVLFGPNGSGKTNLLEAISLLVPGRGLRGARNPDYARRGASASGSWAVAGQFVTCDGVVGAGTGTPQDGPVERRVFLIDGAPARSQSEIADRIATVWLTPQMDRLFVEAASGRRRFLDRLVLALEPGHAREVSAHDAAMAGRNRLLTRGNRDGGWLGGLEDQIARHAVAATAARMGLAARLDTALRADVVPGFPPVGFALACPVADRLATDPAVAVEDWLRAGLAASRERDASAGGALIGAHRCDLVLSEGSTGLPAALASTGEQKAMLLGVVIAHAGLIAEARGFAPILLLDEPVVHLDPQRRFALFAALAKLSAQVLLTGTDAEPFLPLAGLAEGLRTGDGRLSPDQRFPVADPAVPPVPEAL